MRNVKVCILSLVAVLSVVACGSGQSDVASVKSAAVVTTAMEGRIHCSDVAPGLTELYSGIIEPVGTVNVSDGTLSASYVFSDRKTFTWSTNLSIDYVLVGEAAPEATAWTNVYGYSPEATSGGPLTTVSGIDVYYVKLCYDPDDVGCTLTPGYWKTHSKYGPAPYDDTWAAGGFNEDTTFYLSGKTYYEVLNTPPKGGNAYYILAHAFIAAELNVRAGATAPGGTTLADAAALFGTFTPTSTLSAAERAQFISLAGILDDYNNGEIGPGHCGDLEPT